MKMCVCAQIAETLDPTLKKIQVNKVGKFLEINRTEFREDQQ
jgi:hypothetical protein